MSIAFDADVLIYAASGHPLGSAVGRIFAAVGDAPAGIGSVLLLTETLAKPLRADPESAESRELLRLLSRLELRPFDESAARMALACSISYGLRAADAVHLATAIVNGADRFLTNNRRDFPKTIDEIDVIYPDELAETHA
ncbi:MAG: hypothetical protein ABS62_10780 [Microbacterium sp. SCN 70-200]|uniref:type II toxin-antitoxin system VapC family toxin n=1 Tax=unclassified Microbacterium TaxID=2609290 RepID=UPI000869D92C|nr:MULTISPECIES: type II toxin-antitoxin system VapC family toxin [unclassified Microbacterium]MBN9216018.1 type II toxin-antitoxin system VapC family toxin [Microbacterium sp.]ODT40345.1 MAG: hypothetical protein ABS62_10780 [Microbacterium sp. SCN 70-200]OJV82022.1 MAG: hypothetical protein BGO46_05775 [Microbacterium sp. 70-16]